MSEDKVTEDNTLDNSTASELDDKKDNAVIEQNDVKEITEPLEETTDHSIADTQEETIASDSVDVEIDAAAPEKTKKKLNFYKLLRILFTAGFVVFTALFINEVFIQPYRVNKSIELTRNLYNTDAAEKVATPTASPAVTEASTEVKEEELPNTSEEPKPVIQDPNRDEQGRLKQFNDLLHINEDVKGWITIPESNIDYVVMQADNGDKEYYLTRDIEKQVTKAGSLFLDYKSSVEKPTQNLVIHGHNMTSTDNMFHYLLDFKELKYYKKRPVFTFDTIFDKGQWKIFSIFITNGTSKKEPLFNYTKSEFKDSSDFLNFIYQLRIRSVYQMDTVDINENDQILTLSTCSYEVKDYRTVIVARKIREGEDPSVDVDSVKVNNNILYPGTYYYRFGGEAPEFPATFEEALEAGEIKWYLPETDNKDEK